MLQASSQEPAPLEAPGAGGGPGAGGAPEDPFRTRLGRFAKLLPETNQQIDPAMLWPIARRLSVTRTLYHSARFRGPFLVARGTRIVMKRSARVEFAPGGWLFLGFHHHGPDRVLVNLGRDARLVVKGSVQLWRGAQVHVYKGGRLEIGGKNIFSEGSRVICYKSIRFGVTSGMSWDATVIDSDLHPISVGGQWLETEKPVNIGDRCFVGAGATVLKGVTIGSGSIVGAGAVVTKDVPPRSLVAGNPARVINDDIDWV